MKSIWILNHAAITPIYPGGTRHYELAKRIAASGKKVVIFASSVLHQNPQDNILPDHRSFKIEEISKNFKFIWISTTTYKKNDWRRLLNMLTYTIRTYLLGEGLVKRGKLEKPDIIIGSTVHPFTPLMAKCIAKKFGSKYIFEIRDLWPQTFIDMGIWKKDSLVSKFFRIIEKRSILGAKKIIYLSPKVEDYLRSNYSIQKHKLCYIPNGTDVSYFESLKNKKNSLGIIDKKFFNIVFTGAIIQTNRIDIICEAAKNIVDYSKIRIIIIGDGNLKELLMKKYQEIHNIVWMSPVPKKEIPLVLNKADALILVQGNVAWGSSNKLYDYLAAGKPIISSVWVPHNDIVSGINAGYSVVPENSKLLANTILQIFKSPKEERLEMGLNAIKYVKKFHDWDLLSQNFMKLIQ